jgi:hypothetical protein
VDRRREQRVAARADPARERARARDARQEVSVAADERRDVREAAPLHAVARHAAAIRLGEQPVRVHDLAAELTRERAQRARLGGGEPRVPGAVRAPSGAASRAAPVRRRGAAVPRARSSRSAGSRARPSARARAVPGSDGASTVTFACCASARQRSSAPREPPAPRAAEGARREQHAHASGLRAPRPEPPWDRCAGSPRPRDAP